MAIKENANPIPKHPINVRNPRIRHFHPNLSLRNNKRRYVCDIIAISRGSRDGQFRSRKYSNKTFNRDIQRRCRASTMRKTLSHGVLRVNNRLMRSRGATISRWRAQLTGVASSNLIGNLWLREGFYGRFVFDNNRPRALSRPGTSGCQFARYAGK